MTLKAVERSGKVHLIRYWKSGKEYVYGSVRVLLPKEYVGKEAKVIVLVE